MYSNQALTRSLSIRNEPGSQLSILTAQGRETQSLEDNVLWATEGFGLERKEVEWDITSSSPPSRHITSYLPLKKKKSNHFSTL